MTRPVALLGALLLAGCAAGPARHIGTPAPELPASFLYQPKAAEGAAVADLLPQNDRAFTVLAAAALARSPSLLEAIARIDAARAGANRAGAERLPAIGANGSVQVSRTNPDQFGSSLPPGASLDTTRTQLGATVVASWDPDIFGRLRSQERAARVRITAADADAVAVRLALTADIALAVIDQRTLAARKAAIESDAADAEELARLAGVREKAGIAPGFDRLRAETSVAASRSRLEALSSERARLIGRLVTLTAQPAEAVEQLLASSVPSREAPPAPATLPSALLLNRPDIRAASARLAASDYDLAATAAQRFPRFDLSAAIGLLAFGIGGLFDTDAIVGSVGGTIAGPLLDFGRIAAEIEAAEAEKQAAFQRYRGAVYQALGDSETGYALVAAADREAGMAGAEADLSVRQARLAEIRYRAGLSDFIVVLEARRAADGSRERDAAAQGRARRARVLLWQALGGHL
ncbi:MAG TPA: efflux transporter outer membrane subunit [Allosphingosinicella sp.]|nr:efflux transporter outer membrane subunit [Allosphingosinicella sp.]